MTTATTHLALTDVADVADFDTFVGRAATLDPGGAMRLYAVGTTLAMTVSVLPGTGLSGEGTVLALRAVALAEPGELDIVVGLDALADRLVRLRREGGTVLAVPPVPRVEAWAAMAPPRSGWEPVGALPVPALETIARDGIARVATGAPSGSGALAVADLRRLVWSAPTETEPSIPAGAAFAAYSLGFLGRAEVASVARHGRWIRLSTPAGHVLAKQRP